ncbi:MAG TPA: tRNA dihydrouridine synthase DusB [Candidatus Egerieicola pullicola]|uniref:tRNA-dihydrouridine synthase n=1 Tax=Candidatus Egerieicola pullicola TaxID=2840775 RepID=A0A9D1AIJ3_9FIRM|nr:tRNA dihydrouridine synthase DusB [Candidatus Egerieicola pullicola]
MNQLSLFGYTIPRTAMLAPMAGIADRAYRQLCKEYGAVLVVGEMASVKGLCYSDRKTAELLTCTQEEFPMGVQLFGDDPAFFAKAAKIAAQYHPAFIDINMGCPVHKVVSTGAGSRLMTTPEKAAQIVRACVEAVDIPITVKMRKGYNAEDANAPQLAKLCQEEGASAITIHGRTKAQLYQPGADWDIIKQVKQAVSIPVIGNGDVMSAQDAAQMYCQTGCDLVAVARGSYGRPWIFSEITQYLQTGTLPPEPSPEEKMEVMLRHLSLICTYKGERAGMREGRKIAGFYVKGLAQASRFRGLCGSLSTLEDAKTLANEVLQAQKEEHWEE